MLKSYERNSENLRDFPKNRFSNLEAGGNLGFRCLETLWSEVGKIGATGLGEWFLLYIRYAGRFST